MTPQEANKISAMVETFKEGEAQYKQAIKELEERIAFLSKENKAKNAVIGENQKKD